MVTIGAHRYSYVKLDHDNATFDVGDALYCPYELPIPRVTPVAKACPEWLRKKPAGRAITSKHWKGSHKFWMEVTP